MQILFFILAGLASGVIGGMGMGGGTILIPILTLLLGVEQKLAQSINLMSFLVVALVSLILHIKHKLVDFKSLLYLAISGVAASVFGSFLPNHIPSHIQRKVFGAFLLLVGIFQTVMLFIKNKRKKDNNRLDLFMKK